MNDLDIPWVEHWFLSNHKQREIQLQPMLLMLGKFNADQPKHQEGIGPQLMHFSSRAGAHTSQRSWASAHPKPPPVNCEEEVSTRNFVF